MRKRTALLLAAMAAFTGIVIGGIPAESPANATINNPFAHACKHEGSNGCYWDAKRFGNGKGSSYVVTNSGQVFRFDPAASANSKKAFPNG